jgi:hypothetical protein
MDTVLHRARQHAVAIGAVMVIVALLGGGWWWFSQRGREVVFTIPAQTSVRLAAGEDVQVLPETIVLKRNDTLIIHNEDSESVQIGPFLVMPGQRFIQQYYNRGTYELLCSVHKGDQIRIIVE